MRRFYITASAPYGKRGPFAIVDARTHHDAAQWLQAEALATAAQLADLRRALRAYDLAGPLTEARRQALGDVLTLARQLTEE